MNALVWKKITLSSLYTYNTSVVHTYVYHMLVKRNVRPGLYSYGTCDVREIVCKRFSVYIVIYIYNTHVLLYTISNNHQYHINA